MNMDRYVIEKVLSNNDLGLTGTHQAGILIPKRKEILDFFPFLYPVAVNPRAEISFEDESGQIWKFNFIYYNNRFRNGTRNEYRLTGTTAYFRATGLQPGDIMIFSRYDDNYFISYKRMADTMNEETDGVITLKLSSDSWRVVDL